jgi:hypothetical protein
MDQRPARLTTVPAGTGQAVRVAAGGRAHVVSTLGWQVSAAQMLRCGR